MTRCAPYRFWVAVGAVGLWDAFQARPRTSVKSIACLRSTEPPRGKLRTCLRWLVLLRHISRGVVFVLMDSSEDRLEVCRRERLTECERAKNIVHQEPESDDFREDGQVRLRSSSSV